MQKRIIITLFIISTESEKQVLYYISYVDDDVY